MVFYSSQSVSSESSSHTALASFSLETFSHAWHRHKSVQDSLADTQEHRSVSHLVVLQLQWTICKTLSGAGFVKKVWRGTHFTSQRMFHHRCLVVRSYAVLVQGVTCWGNGHFWQSWRGHAERFVSGIIYIFGRWLAIQVAHIITQRVKGGLVKVKTVAQICKPSQVFFFLTSNRKCFPFALAMKGTGRVTTCECMDVFVCLQDCLVQIYVGAKHVRMLQRKQKKELYGMMTLMKVIVMRNIRTMSPCIICFV